MESAMTHASTTHLFIPLTWGKADEKLACKVAKTRCSLTHVYLWWDSRTVKGMTPRSQHFSSVPQTPALCWYLQHNKCKLCNSKDQIMQQQNVPREEQQGKEVIAGKSTKSTGHKGQFPTHAMLRHYASFVEDQPL